MKRLSQVEEVRALKGERRDTHTYCTHEIIVDLDHNCRDVWVLFEGVCTVCLCCMYGSALLCIVGLLSVCIAGATVNVWMCISFSPEAQPTQLTDKYELIQCMTLFL